jgi:anaerobic magnesium-protoporphyrin IX monomethyl ester cyclase
VIAPPLPRRLKVLLVNPGPEPAPGDRNIPMGLIALAATTRLEHDVKIRDWIYERFTDDEFIADIRSEQYDIVGFTSMTWQITTTYRLCAKVKKAFPDLPIILGGIHPTYMSQEAFDTGTVDYICSGEGEETFPEFLRVLFSGGDLSQVAGIVIKGNDGKAITTPKRLLVDLEALPEPARDLVPIKKFLDDGTLNPVYQDMGGVMFSRGCTANCDFCASPDFWRRKVRQRTADQVFAEMTAIQDKYGASAFGIHDDIFTVNRKFILEFCERIAPRRITWTCLARVDQIDEEKLLAMRKGGCVLVSYGVESGNQEVLNLEHKHQSLQRVKDTFALHHRLKVPVCALIIIGHPHENVAALQDTYNLIAELRPTWTICQYMSPYPGTALHYAGIAEREGTVLTWDWSKYVSQEYPVFVPKGLTPDDLIYWRNKILSLNPPDPHVVFNDWTSTYLWKASAPPAAANIVLPVSAG